MRLAFVTLLALPVVQVLALYSTERLVQFQQHETSDPKEDEAKRAKNAGDDLARLDDAIQNGANDDQLDKESRKAETDLQSLERSKVSSGNHNSGHFKTLPEKTEHLEEAVDKLHKVTADAKEMANTAYQKIGAYNSAVQDMKEPMDIMTHTVAKLHDAFKEKWSEDEGGRLQPLSDLQSQLPSSGS